jgi:hypothetical protein
MTQSINTVARARLEALVGEWALEARPPGGPPWPGEGRVTFAWLDDAPLLLQRLHVDLPEAPDVVAVIGCDGIGDTYYQLYTDSRDVQRLYAMSLTDDGVWRLWRDGQPFSQRFTGRFSDDGRAIAGSWEIEEDGAWRTDFDLTYTKLE